MTSGITTLKVRSATRDLITKAARARGTTVDEYLTVLQQEQSWRERIAMASAAMSEPDPEYLEEVAAWDRLAGDVE